MCIRDRPYVGQLYGSWGYELINRIEPNVPINPLADSDILMDLGCFLIN